MSATPTPPSNKPSKPNKDEQADNQHPAQQDAKTLKRWFSLGWLLRLLLVLVLLFVLVCVALWYMFGTDGGTEFLIDKVVNETGVHLNYGEGNLRDGLWVSDVTLTPTDELAINVDKAYVKIGWRAVFNRELHLRAADIDNISITSTKASSGKPFSYPTIELPINLRIDHASIDSLTYTQQNITPLLFKKIEADKLSWLGSQLEIGKGSLGYTYVNDAKEEKDIVRVESLTGKVDFKGDYPIDAKAIATVHSISKHHFEPIQLEATGSLKKLQGKLASAYNGYPIAGDIQIEPLASGTPFTGQVYAKRVKLPYASDYDIQLDTSKIDVSGTWREVSFDIDSNVNAINLPSGHYLGQAKLLTRDSKIDISKLTVESEEGTLTGEALLNWEDSYWMDVHLKSDGYELDNVLPEDWLDFKGYLPKSLDGTVDFKYQHQNKDDKMQIDATVHQKDGRYDGELVEATIIRLADSTQQTNNKQASKKQNQPTPYSITASWKNLYRKIEPELDVHNIGIIDSDKGQAQLYIDGKRLTATIDTQINELNAAPKGHYKVNLERNGYVIDINKLDYLGDVGDLVGSAQVTIPKKENDPILWSLTGETTGFKPMEYSPNIPVELITGSFSVKDVMTLEKLPADAKPNTSRTQRHEITIQQANIETLLDSRSRRKVGLNGNGKVLFTLDSTGLSQFSVDYKGKIDNSDIPKGDYQILAKGTPTDINIDKIRYQGELGKLNGSGKLVLENNNSNQQTKQKNGETMRWLLDADVSELDLASFTKSLPINPVALTGKINTTGSWFTPASNTASQITPNTKNTQATKQNRNKQDTGIQTSKVDGELTDFSLMFDGDVMASKSAKTPKNSDDSASINIPTGTLKIDTSGNTKNITVKHVRHQGQAGFIDGKGTLDLSKGYQWQLNADMKAFDLGFFSPTISRTLTGKIDTTGNWDTSKQQNNLSDFRVKFDGDVMASKSAKAPKNSDDSASSHIPNIPTGKLQIDATGDTNDVTINHIRHQGEAGFINGKGTLNLSNGYQWQLNADMKAFDLGFFSPTIASTLTGTVDTTGSWDTSKQQNNLSDFKVKFDGDIKTDSLPSGKLTLDASSDDNQNITLNRIRHQGEAGFLDAKGTISLADGYQWQINSEMKDFNLGYFIKDMPSLLTGKITSDGHWNKARQQINISDMNVTGELKGKQLTATGNLSADLKLPENLTAFVNQLKKSKVNEQYLQASELIKSLQFNDLVAKWGKNTITANGDNKTLETAINIRDLDQLYPQLKGELTGTVSLKADKATTAKNTLPTLYVDLLAKQLSLPSLQLNNGKIKGKIVDLGKAESKLIIDASELVAGSTAFQDIHAIFIGTEQNHKLNIKLANEQMAFSGNLIGGLTKRQKWQGTLANGKIKSKHLTLSQLQPSEMMADFNNTALQLASHCWQAGKDPERKETKANKTNSDSKLCLNDNLFVSQNKGSVDVTLQKIDTSLLSFIMPADINWRTLLNGTAKVDWKKGKKPDVEATLYSDNGKIGLSQEDNSVTYVPYKRISLIALTTADGLRVRTDINSGGKGKGYIEATIDPYAQDKTINGTMSLDKLNLTVFKPFFPGMRELEGQGSIKATIKGTLATPLINGDLKLTNGRMSMLGLPINLSNINATAKIRNTQSTIDGTFKSGDGKGKLTGTIDWQNSLQAKIGITGEQLDIVQPPLLVAKVNPDINVIVKPADKYVEIKGAVSVPSAVLRPPEENATVVPTSADVTVLDRRNTGNINEVLAITKPWSINANIGLDLGNDVKFRGFGADLPLAGALVLQQRGQGKLTSKGVVQVARRTNIDAFGQSVELNYAQVRFNGDVTKPKLSIEASKNIQSSTVGFRVKGDISDPKITVFNDAGLTEQQAMNALVTGRLNNESANQVSEEGFRSEVTNNLAAAGLSIGLDTTRDLTNQIGRAVGLQSLTLSASGNSNDTNVNVTGYITPDLYIRYGIGVFSAQSELSSRYQLTRNFYIEATSATEKFIDLVYSWQF